MDSFKFHLKELTKLWGGKKKKENPCDNGGLYYVYMKYASVCVCVRARKCYRCACMCVCVCCLQPVTALLSGLYHLKQLQLTMTINT